MGKFIGQARLPYLWENFKSFLASKKYAGGTSDGGTAIRAASIPFGKVDSTSTATTFTATVDGITELKNGTCVYLMNGVVTSAAASTTPKCFTLNINGLGAKPVYYTTAAASYATTQFGVNYTMLFVYNTTRVSSGCWDIFYGYDSNTNTIGYQLRTNSSTLPAKFKTYRYRLLFTSSDHAHFVAANASTSTDANTSKTPTTEKIDPFGTIVYYGYTTAINANANFGATYLWIQYTLNLGYSFNTAGAELTLTYPAPVYVKAEPQTDGSAIIDATTPYVQTLPSTEDGKIYIFLGLAYSATGLELRTEHPVYYYKDGAIRLWSNAAEPDLSGYQETIDDLDDIRAGAALGATALQSYTESDPTVPAWAKQNTKPTYTAQEVGALPSSTTIPTKVSDLTNDSGFTTNTGTITGITMNGASKGTSGVVNLGTVLTEHQSLAGKQDVIGDLATIRSGASAGATAYQKPSGGIPKTDLESAVQTSLGKADSALQAHQSLANYYTKSQVDNLIVPANTTIAVVSSLPASGSANTIYRVAGTNSYTDYGWDGTQFVALATYNTAYDAGGALS